MTASVFFAYSGGLIFVAGGYVLFGLLMWWLARRAPLDTDLWGPGGADEPYGKPVVRLAEPLDRMGDEVQATVFDFPRRPVLDHQLDAEFQRGPWTLDEAA